MEQEIKVKCAGGCGYTLAAPQAFDPLSYCAQYCCGCCPDAKVSPCQKEKRGKGILAELNKY